MNDSAKLYLFTMHSLENKLISYEPLFFGKGFFFGSFEFSNQAMEETTALIYTKGS